MTATVKSATCSMGTQSTTNSEYTLGPELGAIIVDQYEGGFDEHGCYSGQGEALFRSGNKYNGEFRRGIMDGRGRYTWLSDGTVYDGDVRKNELVGAGRYNWSDGSSYEGGVMGGLRHGHGTFTSADGTLVYEGNWQKSKRHGRGEQQYGANTEQVSSYAGDWHENCRHGRGTMTYASGNVYEGDWVEDRKEGRGVMNWVERCERYTGEWKQDLQCGYGEHVWIEERPVSPVSMDTQKQMCNVYRGEWLDGMRHGQGTFMYADGSRYTGQWHKNKKHGPAVFMSDNGRTFEGLFDDDAMLGKMGQDDEHPELTAAVKLKIADILSSGDEATRAAAVRDVERSALQINSDLKFLYKHYAKPEVTAPTDSTMFTMSMEQFMAFARDCRAIAPSTPVTVGEVYRMFFRMRRQHAFELNRSLERAMATGPSGPRSSGTPSSIGSDGGGLVRGGSREGGGSSRGEHRQQATSTSSPGQETASEIYDSRRAITFRECVEGIVRLARIVRLHTSVSSDIDNTTFPPYGSSTTTTAANGASAAAAVTAAANGGGGVPRSITTAASHSTTPRTAASARTGTAPIEGGGSLSLSGRGGSTISNGSNTHDGRAGTTAVVPAAAPAGAIGQTEAARSLAQGRTVRTVNTDFKQFVATHLSGLLARLSEQAVFADGGGGGRAGGKSGGRGGGSSRGVRGGGRAVAAGGRGVGSATGNKRGDEEAGPVESTPVKELSGAEQQVSSLYRKCSGGLFVPMTLRSLLRTVREADLKGRAGLTPEDVKKVFKQATTLLQGRDGAATPKTAGSTRTNDSGAVEAADQDRKDAVPGETLRPSSSPVAMTAAAGGGGGGGLPLPTVDSATVCHVGATPSTVDLDLLDEELMPDEFKVVIAGLFELARDKNSPSPPRAPAATVESSPEEAVALEGEEGGPKADVTESVPDSGTKEEENEAAAQGVPTEVTTNETTVGEDDGGGQGNDSAALEGEEGPSNSSTATAAEEETPEWLADPKTFVSRFLQWADEGSAKRPKLVPAKPPTRVFPL